jgi:ribosome-associated toxin RatA of RatAB toxin-antitoxin module
MGRIRVTTVVKAPPERVYRIARAIETYPSLMPSLKKIEVLECSECGDYVRARWHAEANLIATHRTLTWVQEDHWDDESLVCAFEVDPRERGHYRNLSGHWWFKPHKHGTELAIDLDYQIDHPLMTAIVHKIIDAIMEKNNRALLDSMKRKAESPDAKA